MTTSLVAPELQNLSSIKRQIDSEIDSLVAALPDPKDLTPEQRRGIIARYSAVLEGNFIYWMTAAYLSVRSEEARPILIDNLREEVADCHPEMLRRFAIAAHAYPAEADSMAVRDDLTKVRTFLGACRECRTFLPWAFLKATSNDSCRTWRTLQWPKVQRILNIPTCTVFATLLTPKAS